MSISKDSLDSKYDSIQNELNNLNLRIQMTQELRKIGTLELLETSLGSFLATSVTSIKQGYPNKKKSNQTRANHLFSVSF